MSLDKGSLGQGGTEVWCLGGKCNLCSCFEFFRENWTSGLESFKIFSDLIFFMYLPNFFTLPPEPWWGGLGIYILCQNYNGLTLPPLLNDPPRGGTPTVFFFSFKVNALLCGWDPPGGRGAIRVQRQRLWWNVWPFFKVKVAFGCKWLTCFKIRVSNWFFFQIGKCTTSHLSPPCMSKGMLTIRVGMYKGKYSWYFTDNLPSQIIVKKFQSRDWLVEKKMHIAKN